jgi:hypothetical protein
LVKRLKSLLLLLVPSSMANNNWHWVVKQIKKKRHIYIQANARRACRATAKEAFTFTLFHIAPSPSFLHKCITL